MLILALTLLLLWTPDRDRASLEALYLRAPGDMAQVGRWRLHLRDDGPKGAPALLLLHGFGASLHSWDAWAPGLAAAHRVIRFDLPGSGLSPPDPDGLYTDERTHELMLALLDQLGVARAGIVGHSIGGRAAWAFAARFPERVDKLVLIAPDGFASPGFDYGKAPDVPASLSLMRFVLPKPLLRMSLEPAYADPALLTNEGVTRYHDLVLAPGGREALLARMAQTRLAEPLPLLRQVQAPTMLLWGERDAMIPIANAADFLGALPNARLAALPGVGHLPHEEAPERALAPVIDFLR
jgi:pimeloyl-ACP methyl ester carboxylesterase